MGRRVLVSHNSSTVGRRQKKRTLMNMKRSNARNPFGKLKARVVAAHKAYLADTDPPDAIQTEFGSDMHNKLTGLLAITADLAGWADDHEKEIGNG